MPLFTPPYKNEIVSFTSVGTLILPWTQSRIGKFGTAGSFYVEILGDDGIVRFTFVEIVPDSTVTTTQYTFNFGGSATGRIIIS